MTRRTRVAVAGAAVAAGLVLGGGVAAAAPVAQGAAASDVHVLNYWHMYGEYATQAECVAQGEALLYPNHPGGADDYECRAAANGGWELWLMHLT